MNDARETYRTVKQRLGLIDRSDRVRLEVTGEDRAKFLHNLTTNEVKRLAVGRGCEAFVTSLQGKTLGYVILHVAESSILVRSDAGALDSLLPHFQKYGALDEVTWNDISASTFELHLAGPLVSTLLESLDVQPLDEPAYCHAERVVAGQPVRLIRECPTGLPGVTIIGELADKSQVTTALNRAGGSLGLVQLDPATFDVLRIEAGTPVFGRDITPDNLPQEVGRDTQAINFVKGCYLGQETVARLDALGHVNKILKGARISSSNTLPPEPGTALFADGKQVGTVTSSVYSPGQQASVMLAIIRVAQSKAGTELSLPGGGDNRIVVSDLPMPT